MRETVELSHDIRGADQDPQKALIGSDDGVGFLEFRPRPGEIQIIGNSPRKMAYIPEPSGLVLLGFSLAGLGVMLRRRKAA